MPLPKNITKDHLIEAIEKIDNEGIPPNGRSSTYDVIYKGKRYPPKLVVSYANLFANGKELDRKTFEGGADKECFKVLKNNGFAIELKKSDKKEQKIWIEKTLVKGRPDRINGEFALGKVLWSPQKDKKGGDIYSLMREIKVGDIILHLTDNQGFTGVSLVEDIYHEGTGVPGSAWERDAYVVPLRNFKKINLTREEFLNPKHQQLLDQIRENNHVFYNRDLNLNQGVYITECPYELASFFNKLHKEANKEPIPYLDEFLNNHDTPKSNSRTLKAFNYKDFVEATGKADLKLDKRLILRFISSLCAKPFVILTGLAGSGKTKLAQAFSEWICEDDNQICLVAVGADWTNRDPLLGYPNAIEKGEYVKSENGALDLLIRAGLKENANKPHFLILDEMNLSHVERYFADFLSAMESEKGISIHNESNISESEIPSRISLPKNLFIVGTVNVDETTYMFSPKVLDRASVIEFKVSQEEMEVFLSNPSKADLKKLKRLGIEMAADFVARANLTITNFTNAKNLNKVLLEFFRELKKTGAEFGYRTATEINRFAGIVDALDSNWNSDEIIDAAVMQKLLPKLHGSRRKIESTLKILAALCLFDKEVIDKALNDQSFDFIGSDKVRFPISLEKISRMYRGAMQDGFTSFAEA